MKRILFVANFDAFFISHRLPIAIAALKNGYEVFVICEDTGSTKEIIDEGFNFISLPTNRLSKATIKSEFRYISFLWQKVNEIKPNIIHHISIKPVLYGSLVNKFISQKNLKVNAFSGMGYLFTGRRKMIAEKLFPPMFKFIFNQRNLNIILQNHDDLNYFLSKKIVNKSQLYLIKGSGVDLEKFEFSEIPGAKDKELKFILPARMLKDKGVVEFYEAARIIKNEFPAARFTLCGDIDKGNPTSLKIEQLEQWNKEGIVSWLGFQEDMKNILSQHHVVVLPSYREGLPKALIEACAIGRPIITTDTNGCRECVEDGKNGFLVPVKNSEALAVAMKKLLENSNLLEKFGLESRKLAENEFGIKKVIDQTLEIYSENK